MTRKASVADNAKVDHVLTKAVNAMISAGRGRRYWAPACFGEPPFQVWPGSLWTVVTHTHKKKQISPVIGFVSWVCVNKH